MNDVKSISAGTFVLMSLICSWLFMLALWFHMGNHTMSIGQSHCEKMYLKTHANQTKLPTIGVALCAYTVLPAKSDNDVMFVYIDIRGL